VSYSFDQFTATRTFRGLAYTPSGDRLLYIADTTGQFNLWALPSSGGFAKQLTSFTEERVTEMSVSPGGEHVAFVTDLHGDEMTQVWRLLAAGGWPERLTDAPKAQFMLGEWLPDGERIVVTANDQEPSEQHPQLLDVTTGERHRLLTGGLFYGTTADPSGNHILALEFLGNTDQNLYVFDLTTGQEVLATPHEKETIFFLGPWARDSSGFYLLTNAGREFTGLAFYSLAEGGWSYVFTPEHDVEKVVISADRKLLVVVVNEAGASQLHAFDLHGPERDRGLELPRLPYGVVEHLDVHPSGEKIALLLETATAAGNIFELELASGALRALERSMLGGIRTRDLVEPELVQYPSFDQNIPAWLLPAQIGGRGARTGRRLYSRWDGVPTTPIRSSTSTCSAVASACWHLIFAARPATVFRIRSVSTATGVGRNSRTSATPPSTCVRWRGWTPRAWPSSGARSAASPPSARSPAYLNTGRRGSTW